MYNCKYKKCCCQQNYNNDIIETACNNCGIKCCNETMKEISEEEAKKYLENK